MSQYMEYGFRKGQVTPAHSYLLPVLGKLLNPKVNKNILDVGCGDGSIAKHLIARGYNVYGIDASQSGINIASETHPDRFFLQDITSKQLPPALQSIPFDTVISTEVIEHIYAPRDFLAFCKQVLLEHQREGVLIISTPYHGYLKNVVLALTGHLDKHFTALWDGGHIKFWSRKTLTMLLEEQNFRVVDFMGAGRVPWLWKSMVFKARVSK